MSNIYDLPNLLQLFQIFYKFINPTKSMHRSTIRQVRLNHLNHSIQNLENTWKQFKRNRSKQERLDCLSKRKKIQINIKAQQQCSKKQKIKIILTPKKKSHLKERTEKKFETNSGAKFQQGQNIKQDHKIVNANNNKVIWTVRQSKQENQKQYMQIQDIIRKSLTAF